MKKRPVLIFTILAVFFGSSSFQFNAFAQQETPKNSVRRAPAAATVTVSGKITTADGKAVRGARMTAIRNNGDLKFAKSNPFGFYRVGPLESGETYIFRVTHKRYAFQPRILSLTEDVVTLDFVAQ